VSRSKRVLVIQFNAEKLTTNKRTEYTINFLIDSVSAEKVKGLKFLTIGDTVEVADSMSLNNSKFCPRIVFMFCMNLRTNSDNYPIQH
jgi:hypothetical protein